MRKWARKTFTPFMNGRGFSLVKGSRFEYFREEAGVYKYFGSQQSQWSSAAYFHAYFLIDSSSPGYRVGSRLGKDGIVEIGSSTWPFGNELEAQASFDHLSKLFDTGVVPFFDLINTVDAYKKVRNYLENEDLWGGYELVKTALGA